MNESHGPANEFQQLLHELSEGKLSATGAARLEELAGRDTGLRRRYIQWMHQEESLAREAAAENAPRLPQRPSWKMPGWIAAGSLAAGLALGWMLGLFSRPADFVPPARVVFEQGAEWETRGTHLALHQALPSGPVALRRGVAKIRLESGVEAVIQAPAEFEIVAADRMRLRRGRVAVDVPEGAEGFRVETPEGEVIDLGTAFGVSVDARGRSDVVVYEGRVDVKPFGAGAGVVPLKQGAAIRLDRRGRELDVQPVESDRVPLLRTVEPVEGAAGLLIREDFRSYADGPMAGRSGGWSLSSKNRWEGEWRLFTRSVDSRHDVRGGVLRVGGDNDAHSSLIRRMQLGHPAGESVYFSVRLNVLEQPGEMSRANLSFDDAQVNIGTESGRFRLKLGEGNDRRFGAVEPGRWYRLVGRLEFNTEGSDDRLAMWVDPASEASPPDVLLGGRNIGRDLGGELCLHSSRQAVYEVSDVRVGTTFESVISPE